MGQSSRYLREIDSSIRITVDFKRLKNVKATGKLPTPRIDEFFDSVGTSKTFTTFELLSGLFQTAIHPATVETTALCTPSGSVRAASDAHESCGCSGHFPASHTPCYGRSCHVRMYTDDAMVFNPDPAFHVSAIRDVLAHLRLHDLELSPNEARLGSPSISVFGHTTTPAGLGLMAAQATALSQNSMPTNVSHLRSILGRILPNHSFLPDFLTVFDHYTAF